MLTNTTEIGTATLPRRRLTIPAPTDVSPSAPRRPPRFPALAQFASAARRVPRAPIPVAFALAVLAVLATVAPEPAAAQTVTTFISNTGQTAIFASDSVLAVAFTTGTGTYTLSSVGIFINIQSVSPTPAVKIYGDSGGNPGTTLLATMTNPGTLQESAVNSFTAPANTTLSASTTYWVVTSNSAATNGQGFRVGLTNPNLDSGTAAGWSLGNARSKIDIAATSWNDSSYPLLFEIRGTSADTTPPTLTSADVEITDALSINLVFSEDLQLSNPPALSAFTVTVDGSAATVSSVGVPGSVLPQNELWLQLSTAIRQRQAVVVTYTDATSGDDTAAIQDTAGNDAATFTTGMDGVPAVTNNSTVTKTVPADWSLIPTGLSTGDKFRLLFLSSTKRDAESTDIATTTPSSRPAPRPATPTSGTTARTSGRSAAPPTPTPETTLKPPTPAPPRASPSTGSTAPRPPTSTRISTTGPGTTRPTTRTSPAPTRTIPPRTATGLGPAATTTAPRLSRAVIRLR